MIEFVKWFIVGLAIFGLPFAILELVLESRDAIKRLKGRKHKHG